MSSYFEETNNSFKKTSKNKMLKDVLQNTGKNLSNERGSVTWKKSPIWCLFVYPA